MTDREAFARAAGEFLANKVANPLSCATDYTLRLTSGTSGKPLLTILPYLPGVTTVTRARGAMLICTGSLSSRFSAHSGGQRQESGDALRTLLLDQEDMEDGTELVRLCGEYGVEKIAGAPSFILRVAQALPNALRERVSYVHHFGEPNTAALYERLHTFFPNAEIISTYVSMELGLCAVSCAHLSPGQYHPLSHVTLRISEPDDTGLGEILITMSVPQGLSVEEYRSGDAGRLHKTSCACGAAETLEVLGRLESDVLKVGGFVFYTALFDAIAARTEGVDDYRAVVGEEYGRVSLSVEIFSHAGPGTEELARTIAEGFERSLKISPTKTYADAVAEGKAAPVMCIFRSSPFPQSNKHLRVSKKT